MNRTFVAIMTIAAGVLSWRGASAAQPVGVDPFLCYRAKSLGHASPFPPFAPRRGDVVTDRFSSSAPADQHKLDLRRPVTICAPVRKDGVAPQDAATHLEGYSSAATKTVPRQPRPIAAVHEVQNQLGTLKLLLKDATRFLVPSGRQDGTNGAPEPTGSALDRFTCHAAKLARAPRSSPPFPTFTPVRVAVEDQLGAREIDLKRPTRVCAPADLNGQDPAAPGHLGHLVCYQAKLARTDPPQPRFVRTEVSTHNEFGTESLVMAQGEELCLPSLVDPPAATPTPGPGPSPTPGILKAIKISPASRTVNSGGSASFTATGEYEGGATKNLTQLVMWSSSDPNVATATNPDGSKSRIDAVGPGTAVVSATDPVTNISSTASGGDASFTVLGALLGIALGPDAPARNVGEFVNLTATGSFEGGVTKNLTQQLVYASSDPSVAVATNLDGSKSRVEAVGPGVATISATDPITGVSSTDSGEDVIVNVLGPLQRIELTPATKTRPAGGVQNYTGIGHYAGGGTKVITQQLVYASSDPGVAVATNLEGNRSRVETVAPGVATISATDPDTGITTTASGDDATLTVTAALDVLEHIALSPTTVTQTVGASETFTATGFYASGATQNLTQQLDYASSDPAVAVASNVAGNKSRVAIVGPGTAVISATDPVSGVSSTDSGEDATITVLGALERITLSPLTATRAANQILHYTATGHYAGGVTQNLTQQLVYASSDPTVAAPANAVGDKSRVDTLAPGSVLISATDPVSGIRTTDTGDDVTLVVIGALESITLTPALASRTVGQAQNYTATGHFAGGTTQNLTQQVVYASSDPAVAVATNTAGNKSRVEAVGAGTATISATHPTTGITSTASGGDAVLTVQPGP